MPNPSRRQLLAGVLPLVALHTHPAHAASFTYKLACNMPASHPLSRHAEEAANGVDVVPFRQTLQKAGFYAEWKRRYGDEAWGILETSVGDLA